MRQTDAVALARQARILCQNGNAPEPILNIALNDSATLNLQRLCLIRGVVLTGQCIALLFAVQVWQWPLPVATLSAILAAMALITLATAWRAKQRWPITDEEFVVHLLVDVIALTLVMYEVGGASNPFVSFFLVPICIAATTLPWRFTWLVAASSVTAYSGLLFFYIPLLPLEPHHAGSGINLHVMGMWFNFAVSAVLITYFVVQMSGAVRRRDQELAKVREQRLQDEQLLAVATLAAGTAHELGTPLGTMRIVTDELLDDDTLPDALRDDLTTLDSQLVLCKDILGRLTTTAQDFSAGRTRHIPVRKFFSLLKEHWQLLRPSVHDARFTIDVAPQTLMLMDTTLEQAIINLLNNAADVSPEQVALNCSIENGVFVVAIEDEGPGLPHGQADNLGKPFVSAKGLGLGLFVSHAAANRYGGELIWHNRKVIGSRVELRLPCQGVLVDEN
ncbi:MAG TPA: sensor histidine kinase [Spongiibacteraceae bacterium]|nr:sensor histidine kinase [Spongiibacteraceae bacterium]|tara:strand:+ start:282 stop:1625 length:1344 start_codon:yes stop_codon:yes gene_type:complete